MIRMAGLTQRNKISQFVGGLPVPVEQPERLDMMNINSDCSCFPSARTAFIAVPLQCQFSLLVPVRAIIASVATLICRGIFGLNPHKIIPAFDRTKAGFVAFTQFTFSRLLEFRPALFADMEYRRFSQFWNRFARLCQAYIFRPTIRFLRATFSASPIDNTSSYPSRFIAYRTRRKSINRPILLADSFSRFLLPYFDCHNNNYTTGVT
jgi:hypothetical protein